jgi:hypothetical protein
VAKQFSFYDDWKSEILRCPKCGWSGTFEQGSVEHHAELMDCSCPVCDFFSSPMLAIVSWPTIIESRANWDKLSHEERINIEEIESYRAEFLRRKLRDASQLPDIAEHSFVLHWDFVDDGIKRETAIKHGDDVIFTEPAVYEGYERFIEVAEILRVRYGDALRDLFPTDSSQLYLYGDALYSLEIVSEARKRICSKSGNI